MPKQLFRLNTKPGIRRDVALLDNDFYTDGVWCRFLNQRPKKIGGYRRLLTAASAVRGLHSFSETGLLYTHFGLSSYLYQALSNKLGMGTAASSDRTPTTGFTSSADNLWTLDLFSDLAGTARYLLAHPGRNLTDIDSQIETSVFFGAATATSVLTKVQHASTTDIVCSGGVVAAPPYVFVFGNDGIVKNCRANNITDWVASGASDANEVRVAKTKVVAGKQLTGGGASPAVLFWALDSVFRASYVGGGQVFRYDTIAADTSILSSRAVVEDGGQFFWPGVDQFYVSNGGSVQELPNNFNAEWFFNNLNWEHRQKVFGLAIKRYNELWWFFPKGSSTECNHAIVYNRAEQFWFDTPTPVRTAGIGANVMLYPLIGGEDGVWQHEFNVDEVDGSVTLAIPSSFTTNELGIMSGGPAKDSAQGIDRWTEIDRIEPEFIQVGDMTVEMLERRYTRDTPKIRGPFTFSPTTETIDETTSARLLQLRFESNVANGDYHMGSTFINIGVGDE